MKLKGIVEDGEGAASFWINKYCDAYQLWTGMSIIPGSLNINLSSKFDWNAPILAPFKKIYSLVSYGGNRDICLIPCQIYTHQDYKIYAFLWATTNALNDPFYTVLEVIASVKLRDTLNLNNGSVVFIDLPLPWQV